MVVRVELFRAAPRRDISDAALPLSGNDASSPSSWLRPPPSPPSRTQIFLSTIGLKKVVTAYSANLDAEMTSTNSGSNSGSGPGGAASPSFASAARITSGRLYRGGGRALGTVASNRSSPPSSSSTTAAGRVTGGGARPAGGRGAAGETGFPLLGRSGGEERRGGGGGGGGDQRGIDV